MMLEASNRQIAALALSLLDLTDLTDDCTPEAIEKLALPPARRTDIPQRSASGRVLSLRRATFLAPTAL